jgi:hypothetical protein
MFNKFIIYVVGVDLLLSTLYFYRQQQTNNEPLQDMIDIESCESDNEDTAQNFGTENEETPQIVEEILENTESNQQQNENDDSTPQENEDNTAQSIWTGTDNMTIQNEITAQNVGTENDLNQNELDSLQDNPRRRRGRPPKHPNTISSI